MSKFTDAAVTIKKAAAKYENMVALAKLLEEIGSLETIAKEQKAAAEKASEEARSAIAGMNAAKAKMAEVESSAKLIIEKAMAEAESGAAELIRHAEVDAANILKKAQDDASQMVAQAASEKARLSSEIGGLQKSVVDAKGELLSLAKARDEAVKQKEQAEEQLASLREKIKQLLG